jgi:hypothetical protein
MVTAFGGIRETGALQVGAALDRPGAFSTCEVE